MTGYIATHRLNETHLARNATRALLVHAASNTRTRRDHSSFVFAAIAVSAAIVGASFGFIV